MKYAHFNDKFDLIGIRDIILFIEDFCPSQPLARSEPHLVSFGRSLSEIVKKAWWLKDVFYLDTLYALYQVVNFGVDFVYFQGGNVLHRSILIYLHRITLWFLGKQEFWCADSWRVLLAMCMISRRVILLTVHDLIIHFVRHWGLKLMKPE